MKTSAPSLALAATLLPFVCSFHTAARAASYYIRPYTISGPAGTIDGLQQDGAYFGTQGFNNGSVVNRATVDLQNGELKAYAAINDTIGHSMAMAEYSDTLTIRNGANSTFEFTFSYDGHIVGDGKSVPENHLYHVLAYGDFAIFHPGEATWDTWWDLANAGEAMFYDFKKFDLIDELDDFSENIYEEFTFSTPIDQSTESYQFFARIQFAVVANTPQTVELDFGNTGTFSFYADPSAEVYSASGVLPNTLAVPEPSSALLAGLAGSFMLLRRRRAA